MRKIKLITIILVLVLLSGALLCVNAAEEPSHATILFTHDLHSHLLPTVDSEGDSYGGYARLMTLIQQQKQLAPDAILVDGGDFSMGSLFQTAYTTSAVDLRMLGAMGYDVTTFGNHEYDYLQTGFASMLNAAVNSQEPLPAIVEANYLPPKEGQEGYTEDSSLVADALSNYGVQEYMILERGGIYYVLFGIFGIDSDACTPDSGQILYDPIETAQRVVQDATEYCRKTYNSEPLVVCLSHSGTVDGKGEDYELAKAVPGIDLIVSGHTHTTLHEPIQVGDTYIVSAGEYGKYLGVVNMDLDAEGNASLISYDLLPVNDTVEEESGIAALTEKFKADVEENYLAKYGLTFDQVVAVNAYEFDALEEVCATAHESTLGNVFSDAYRWAAEKALGHRVDIAVTASGVIRESIPIGDVTVSNIFNAASIGVGTEGELVEVWLTGADLKCAIEVDASVQPLMETAQLFYSGVEYSFNTNRMIFNKVDYMALRREDGTLEPIQDDQLYCVAAGMYMAQMLGSVEETSMGLLSIVPRDAQGNPLDMSRLEDCLIRDANGDPLKEWYAIVSYLQEMGGQMDPAYAQPDGRKIVYSSWNPIKLLANANRFTYVLLAVIAVIVLLVFGTVQLVKRRKKRKAA